MPCRRSLRPLHISISRPPAGIAPLETSDYQEASIVERTCRILNSARNARSDS